MTLWKINKNKHARKSIHTFGSIGQDLSTSLSSPEDSSTVIIERLPADRENQYLREHVEHVNIIEQRR